MHWSNLILDKFYPGGCLASHAVNIPVNRLLLVKIDRYAGLCLIGQDIDMMASDWSVLTWSRV